MVNFSPLFPAALVAGKTCSLSDKDIKRRMSDAMSMQAIVALEKLGLSKREARLLINANTTVISSTTDQGSFCKWTINAHGTPLIIDRIFDKDGIPVSISAVPAV